MTEEIYKKPEVVPADAPPVPDRMNAQSRAWDNQHWFNTDPTYSTCYGEPNDGLLATSNSIDDKVAIQGRRRNNEKRVLDGAVSKNMYHYRKNFADELVIEESRPWWGRNEY